MSGRSKKIKGIRASDPFLERERERYEFPLPSREFVLQVLTEHGAPIFVDELMSMLSILPEEETQFHRRMAAMEREGQVMINRKGALCLPDKLDLLQGRVQGHADGFGFLVPDDGSSDLYLGPKEMAKVLHGDRVLVRPMGLDRRGRREGSIVEVLVRSTQKLVGRLHGEHGVFTVTAEDKRISHEILLEPNGTMGAESGQVVMVELVTQPSRYSQPVGRVVQVLGNYADPGMEIEIALRKHNLPHEFSAEAILQGEDTPTKVRKKDWKKVLDTVEREDLRDLPLVTIDGETAKDFDDAVYAEKKGKGWRLIVAIADVSHYVLPGDALDVGAIERGNSVYFPRRVIPMLPEALSNGICSLMPDVERLCMVCDMQITAKGEIKKYRFYPAVMHSKARLTYTKVWDMIQHPVGEMAQQYQHVLPQIDTLYALFKAFSAARALRGAIDFETVETEMRFDDKGKISEIVPVVRNDAHKLIEECMLAANVCAADILLKKEHDCVYRVHEGPTPEKLENLRTYIKSVGLTLDGEEDPTAGDYAVLLEKIKLREDAPLLQTMLLRSLSQAVYSPDNKGHFGLSYDAYTHFTSPIRRYPDLLVHRAIKAILAGKKYTPAMKWEALGTQCSMTERRADDASRDVQNWLKCYYMQDKVGEEFEGVISAVTGFGIFVLLDNVFVEGLVHISELGTDYFHFDEVRKELKGERTGQVYRITGRVKIKVARVSLETSKIDFMLVEEKPMWGDKPVAEVAAGRRNAPPRSPAPRRGKPVAAPAAKTATAAKPAAGVRKTSKSVAKPTADLSAKKTGVAKTKAATPKAVASSPAVTKTAAKNVRKKAVVRQVSGPGNLEAASAPVAKTVVPVKKAVAPEVAKTPVANQPAAAKAVPVKKVVAPKVTKVPVANQPAAAKAVPVKKVVAPKVTKAPAVTQSAVAKVVQKTPPYAPEVVKPAVKKPRAPRVKPAVVKEVTIDGGDTALNKRKPK
ncbi:RNAse R [Iodobacter fluviatilis]|uniref:Ribonuclease R n=1 Tax=Iodobacter fluviatilis TaxID=537 RepID=A0A377Q838_9NEIS|nr:ribonuclease R [Iodobacter fluviatilis]TCU89540.1 RNAse R [Iodobacter fluviatilis]STQ90910.1 Ribonuclease R [Iodobacter fluviatilis]